MPWLRLDERLAVRRGQNSPRRLGKEQQVLHFPVRRFLGLTGKSVRPPSQRATFRPQLEQLEGRLVPATLHVGADEQYHTIQTAVNRAHHDDTILVDPGTYREQVTISGSGKNGITLKSVKPLAAVIKAPLVMTGDNAIVEDQGAKNVTVEDFTITGPRDGIRSGVEIGGGGSATISGNHITDIHDTPLSGDQNGVGVRVGDVGDVSTLAQTGSAVVSENVIDDYQKGGVVIDNAGSSAVVIGNTVTGVGKTSVIAQNGIQISNGATADVSGNDVSGNVYTPLDPSQPFVATGILLVNPGTVTVENNTVHHNDVGVYAQVTSTASAFIDIDHNRISNSKVDGIDLDGTTGARVSHNEVSGSVMDGIYVWPGSKNNTIDNNSSTNNGHDGIFVDAGTSGNRLTYNTLRGNGRYDAEDLSGGTGTAGTANFWDDNRGKTENPPGLLENESDGHEGDGQEGDGHHDGEGNGD
jgi:parallel beta-helix repeat protein